MSDRGPTWRQAWIAALVLLFLAIVGAWLEGEERERVRIAEYERGYRAGQNDARWERFDRTYGVLLRTIEWCEDNGFVSPGPQADRARGQ